MANPININSVMEGWVDRGPWRYWDNISVPTGTAMPTSFNPFSVPIGGQDPITTTQKTKYNTNMQRGNQFPPPRCLVMRRLMFYFDPRMLLDDIQAFMGQYVLEFRIDDKIFWEGHIQEFPAGFGLTGVTTNTGVGVYQNGIPGGLTFTLDYGAYGKYIAPQQQFSCTVYTQTTVPTLDSKGTVGLNTFVYLDGLTDRSVQ